MYLSKPVQNKLLSMISPPQEAIISDPYVYDILLPDWHLCSYNAMIHS
jgi:hypothetical protein